MKNLISILSLTLLCISVHAQTDAVKERELQVEKNYNNEIYAVHPVFDFGNITIPNRSAVTVGLESMAGAPSFAPALDINIKPVAYNTTLSKSGHKGMLKFDKGTINPWHVQGGYVYAADNHFTIHATGEYDKWAESLISDQHISNVTGNIGSSYYITSDLKASIDLNYSNQLFGLYAGQKAKDEALNNSNHFGSIGVDLGIQTFKTLPAKWNMGLDIKAVKWNERNTDNAEYNLEVKPHFQYRAGNTLTLKTSPAYNLSKSDAFKTAFLFSNVIGGELDYKTSNVSIGLNSTYFNSTWNLWPSTNIIWNIADTDEINFSTKQNVFINTANYISNYNPYVNLNSLPSANGANALIKDFYVEKNVSLSFQSKRIKDLEIITSVSYHMITDDQNFELVENEQKFTMERVDFNLLKLKAGGSYSMLEKSINTGLTIQYNKYMNPSDVLLHRPEWEIRPNIQSHLINNRLHLEISTNINSPQLLGLDNGNELKSSWRTNVSFEAKFELLDRLNIYLNADNIINDEYQVWNGYNNFGRNLSAGILLKI